MCYSLLSLQEDISNYFPSYISIRHTVVTLCHLAGKPGLAMKYEPGLTTATDPQTGAKYL